METLPEANFTKATIATIVTIVKMESSIVTFENAKYSSLPHTHKTSPSLDQLPYTPDWSDGGYEALPKDRRVQLGQGTRSPR